MTAIVVIWYVVFAVIAMSANLATQRVVFAVLDGELAFGLALVAGTGVGLIAKYQLDRRWIFGDMSRGLVKQGKKFALYTAFGGATTILFWVTEAGFFFIYQTDTMREVGAVLGLSIGYALKYQLDKRFVFQGSHP